MDSNVETVKDKSVFEILLKKGSWLYLFTYFAIPIGYLTRVFISNSLTVQEIGVLYSLVSLMTMLSAYNDLGLTESLKYFLPKYIISNKYNQAKTVLVFSTIIQSITSIVIIAIIFQYGTWLANNYFGVPDIVNVIYYFTIYFLATNIIQTFSAVSLSIQDTFSTSLVVFIKSLFIGIGIFRIFFTGKITFTGTALIFVIGTSVAAIIAIIIYFYKFQKQFSQGVITWKTNTINTFLKYSFWTFLSMNAALLFGQIDHQMILFILGPEQAGIFANYLSLFSISNFIIMPIFGIVFPFISKISAKNNIKQAKQVQEILYTRMGIFSLRILGFLIVLGPEIATVLYGVKFLGSGELLYFGGISILSQTIIVINFSILSGFGQARLKGILLFVTGLFNILMNIYLIKFFGIYGVIISTVIGFFIIMITSAFLVQRIFTLSVQWGILIRNIFIVSLINISIFLFIKQLFVLDNTFRFINLKYLVLLFFGYGILFIASNFKQIKSIMSYIRSQKLFKLQ